MRDTRLSDAISQLNTARNAAREAARSLGDILPAQRYVLAVDALADNLAAISKALWSL